MFVTTLTFIAPLQVQHGQLVARRHPEGAPAAERAGQDVGLGLVKSRLQASQRPPTGTSSISSAAAAAGVPGLEQSKRETQRVGQHAGGAADAQAHGVDAREAGVGGCGRDDLEDRERDRELVHRR